MNDDPYRARERAARGLALITAKGYRARLDRATLDVAHPGQCPCGQVGRPEGGDPAHVMQRGLRLLGFGDASLAEIRDHGFLHSSSAGITRPEYAALTAAFKALLA